MAPTVEVGDGSVLQVATRTSATLAAQVSGTGPFTYSWTQTAGPDATVLGATDGPQLAFTAPSLAPTAQNASLTFSVTVRAAGGTATATAPVEVVWGDDGLQVQLAGGADSLVATTDTPVVVTSTVTSAGAPYQYAWSVQGDLDLPSGTGTNGPTLAFTAPDQPAEGTVQLRVTDSFGRVTTESVPVAVTELPDDEVPAALCTALADLSAGRPATLTGAGGATVLIPSATVQGGAPSATTTTITTTTTTSTTTTTTGSTTTTTVPAPTCAPGTATFTDATVTLPGGLVLTGAAGTLSAAGVQLQSATVQLPAGWSTTSPALAAPGLLLPFVSSSGLGAAIGTVTASGVPFDVPTGWNATTTLSWSATTPAVALVAASGTASSGAAPSGAALTVTGTATAAPGGVITDLNLTSVGLAQFAGLGVPVSGALRSDGSGWTSTATGALTGVPLATDLTLASLRIAWSPTAASGTAALELGPGGPAPSGPVVLQGATATITFADAPLVLGGGALPALPLSGTATFDGPRLGLTAASPPAGPTTVGSATVTGLAARTTADCTLSAGSACGLDVQLSASLTLPGAATPAAVSGGWTAGAAVLSGPSAPVTVAPLTVGSATATLTLTPNGATIGVTGTATVASAPRATTVSFAGPPMSAAALGNLPPAAGWTLGAAVAVATAADSTYQPANGAPAVPVAAGALSGVATVALPSALASALPAALSSGTATFDPASTSPTRFGITVAAAGGWVPVGKADAAVSVAVDSLSVSVAVTGGLTTVGVTGTATLSATSFAPAGPSTVPAGLTGTLAAGSLAATVTPAGGAWPNYAGVAGLDLSGLAVQLSTGANPSATLTANAALPSQVNAALGVPDIRSATASAQLADAAPCLVVDLRPAGGVNLGAAGLLLDSNANLTVAPVACGEQGAASGAGLVLAFTPSSAPPMTLALDPVSFSGSAEVTLGTTSIGGLPLSGTTVAVAVAGGATSMTVTGSAVFDQATVPVSGTVVEPANGVSQITFTGTAPQLELAPAPASFVVTDARISTTVPSSIGFGDPTVAVAGTTSLLGNQVAVSLSGTEVGTTISDLKGTVPSTTFALAFGDQLVTSLDVSIGSGTDPVTVTSPANGATLTTPTRSIAAASVTLTATGFDLTAAVTVPGTLGLPTLSVTGPYTTVGSGAGTYSFANPSTADVNLAGFTAASTVTFARAAGAPTDSASMAASVPLGLFDQDDELKVSGTIDPNGDASLTGSLDGVTFRGLAGTATVTFAPGGSGSPGTGWYGASITYDTDPGDCSMWSGAPKLTGTVYRSMGTTYYTLTGTTSLNLPETFDKITRQYDQPVVLSNEYPSDDPQPADGITLALGVQAPAFSFEGSFAFAVASCSWTAAATLTLTFAQGSQSQALGSSLSPAGGVQNQAGNPFGPGGSAPADLLTYREAKEATAYSAAFAKATKSAVALATSAAGVADDATQDLQNAVADYQAAQDELAAARQALAQALDDAAAGNGSQLAGAEDELDDAESGAAGSSDAVAAAQARLEEATNTSNLLQAQANDAQDTADQALAAAQDANDAAEQTVSAEEQLAAQKVRELTVSWTHCTTCQPVDDFQIDGEILFANTYVVGADLSVGFTDGSFASITGSVTGGFERQETAGWSHLNVYAMAEITLTLTVGYSWIAPAGGSAGWNTLDITADAQAEASVNLDLWLVTYSATLADISGTVEIEVLPLPVRATGDLYLQFLGVNYTVSFGPDEL
ncbi:MAG: hypothetical protein ACOYOP_15525 [Microthrixaceae bacterium]